MATTWREDRWKVRFKKHDHPNHTARLFAGPRGAVLVEHDANRLTRAREITLDGAEPRRSEGLRAPLRLALPIGNHIAILVDGALAIFDPTTFTLADPIALDPLSDTLAVSPANDRVYVGRRGLAIFTQVVNWRARTVAMLNRVVPPDLALPLESGEELWLTGGEPRVWRACAHEPPEIVETIDVAELRDLDQILRVGGQILALGSDRRPDKFPFPGVRAGERALVRIATDGLRPTCATLEPRSTIESVLGVDAAGRVIVLDAGGKDKVQLRDPATLRVVATRAFRKNGGYGLATALPQDRVLAFRRSEKLDRISTLAWAPTAERAVLRIADATVTDD